MIANMIQGLHEDLRAEVIINDLIINGQISEDQYFVYKEGQFTRPYRYDILKVQSFEPGGLHPDIVQFNLSRDSLYDVLPQVLTHSIKRNTNREGVDGMVRAYQEQKIQQKAARTFFQPYENEFFSYGVRIENWERSILQSLNSNLLPEMFYEFWGIPKDLPSLFISNMMKLLPYAHKMIGDLDLSAHILSLLLNEDVKIEPSTHCQYAVFSGILALNDMQLGIDSVIGASYDDYSLNLNVYIGPLKNTRLEDCIDQGKVRKAIHLYYQYFFNMESEVITCILPEKGKEMFELLEESIFLGYNTKI